jgi:hypothetical protein
VGQTKGLELLPEQTLVVGTRRQAGSHTDAASNLLVLTLHHALCFLAGEQTGQGPVDNSVGHSKLAVVLDV